MIGKKTLAELREEVRAAFAAAGDDADEWLERELAKLQGRRKPKQGEIDTLFLLRDALAAARPAKRRKVGTAQKTTRRR